MSTPAPAQPRLKALYFKKTSAPESATPERRHRRHYGAAMTGRSERFTEAMTPIFPGWGPRL